MTQKVSTTVSDEFWNLKDAYGFQWAEALRIGIALLALERGENNLNSPLNAKRIKSLAEKVGLEIKEKPENET